MAPLHHPAAGRGSHLTRGNRKEVTLCNRKTGRPRHNPLHSRPAPRNGDCTISTAGHSDFSRGITCDFASRLIRPATQLRRAGPYEISRGNAESCPTAPPAHTLSRPGAPSISFAPVVQARHHLDRADRLANFGYGSVFRLKPFRPHLTVGALSCATGQPDTTARTHGHRTHLPVPPGEALPPPSATDPAWGRSGWTFTSKFSAPPGAHYEAVRPPAAHRYSAPCSSSCLEPSLTPTGLNTPIGSIAARGSHVPHRRLTRARVTFMPDTTWPGPQAPARLIPGQDPGPGSDAVHTLSAPQQWFTRVRLPGSHLTHRVRLFRSAHHPGSFTEAARGGFGPPLHERSRRAHLHHQCSTTTSDTTLYIATSSCVRGARTSAPLAAPLRARNASQPNTRTMNR